MRLHHEQEILEVARRQKGILWLFLVNVLTGLGGWHPLLAVLVLGITSYMSYRFAAAVKSDMPLVYALFVPIPFLGIVLLLILNHRATAMLRTAGLRVGLMGVPRRQIKTLAVRLKPKKPAPLKPATREFKIACPHCSQHLACDAGSSGVQIDCPACGGALLIPESTG